VARDISERKRAEEILAEYARKQEKLALIDELTGLHNRRGFLTLAAHQLRTSDRLGQRVHLLFADLDGMKWINDNLGHGMGDQALQEAAELLRATFREADLLARLGGDEFAVLAMNGNSGGGEVIARRFAEKIASFNRREGRSYRLSISIGVASYDPASPCSIEELLERGDALMYEQKQTMKRRENQTSSYRAVDP
jgi:diguanylate cyclase (GGDEF)-like protein